ncbi:hypothetical protein MFUM_570008 [Methylacidiphilum fumariolicum SolV]|uniref:Uncharacterized protein n=2 Tax=Candidatus Methylacidiphilum fumarolicum TaxID=591154 RepID=I0JYH4_METFB|nr:conserved protein of unknown function [Candidatus Methylacidiphilum fumarolicum]CCG92293.1 hypothetical protein MFUM_570008 [Methylacidiphilum fumariolicum SolV]
MKTEVVISKNTIECFIVSLDQSKPIVFICGYPIKETMNDDSVNRFSIEDLNIKV